MLLQLVLAPRVGAIVCELLGIERARLYHDNALSRCPGSPRTRWHCDDGPAQHMAMSTGAFPYNPSCANITCTYISVVHAF